MRVIILNKKRLGVSIIIIGLMIIMFSMQNKFRDQMKLTTLMQSNINSLKEYTALNGKLTYKLPSEWITTERSFGGSEIIYHNDFQSKDLKIHGFAQVWDMKEDLDTFLKKSEEISKKQNIISNYSVKEVTINNRKWKLVEYVIQNSENLKFRSYEYFIKSNDKLIRFSFFVRNENFKENMPVIFKTIVQTLNYDGK
ncbi:hypothetical protein [Clostridium lundense]|uniref:hypothetical protein n=1 Tax=Clostridium lundense TaxID=319475 RepID=UPI00048920AD|nr:hypothetical protein [Clostridium lundense]